MTLSKKAVYVIPVGPGDDDHNDTIKSVLHYADAQAEVVVVDDRGLDGTWRAEFPSVHVVAAPDAPGGWGGLYYKLGTGMTFAVENLQFDLLIRMDTDALLIGTGFEEKCAKRFQLDNQVGILGAWKHGPDGSLRDWTPAANVLRSETGIRGLRHPRRALDLQRLTTQALRHGYELGENALGGCYVMSGTLVKTFHERKMLQMSSLIGSMAGEDHIFSLLARSLGFRIGDFSGIGDPMAIKWKGLSASPQLLNEQNRLVIHSLKSFGHFEETTSRAYFAERRELVRNRSDG